MAAPGAGSFPTTASPTARANVIRWISPWRGRVSTRLPYVPLIPVEMWAAPALQFAAKIVTQTVSLRRWRAILHTCKTGPTALQKDWYLLPEIVHHTVSICPKQGDRKGNYAASNRKRAPFV